MSLDRLADPNGQRPAIPAEGFFPERGQRFLRALESTRSALDVWELIKDLGRACDLPMIDFISAADWRDWSRTLFVRTSYDASWLHAYNADPELYRWSYFRSHGLHHLTPICVGYEFVEDYRPLPLARIDVLREAARRGMRAGISIPLRHSAPPSAAMITFTGDHDRADLLKILGQHGWTLTTAAWAAHQRYLLHFGAEFLDRNRITPKQRELLEMVGAGLLDKQIAERLGVSISAIRQRLNALMQKTGTANRAEVAALAMSLGIMPDPLNRPESPATTVVLSDGGGELKRGGD